MKRVGLLLAVIIAVSFATQGVVAQPLFTELLVDGDFESTPSGSSPTSFPAGGTHVRGAWTLQMNQPDNSGGDAGNAQTGRFQDAPFADNNGDGGQIGIWFRSNEGNQDPGDIPADAEFSQNVAAGPGEYRLTFWEQHEEFFTVLSTGKAEVAMDFLDSGSSIIGSAAFDLFSTPPTRFATTPSPPPFRQNTLLGTAPAGTTSSTVRATMEDGVNNVLAGFQGLTMDDFSLQRVPEPTSIVLLGMGSLGMLLRRRS